MTKPKFLSILIIALGIGGGVTRGFMLGSVFNKTTALPQPNHPLTWTLIGLAVLAAFFSLFTKADDGKGNTSETGSGARKTWLLLACLVLGASSVVDFVGMIGGEMQLIQLVLACLGMLTAIVVALLAAAGKIEKLTLGFFATIAVFWAFFWFITLFGNNSSNPIVLAYIFEFMAALFTMLACYMLAGYYFGLVKPRMLGITVNIGLFFTLTSLLSPVIAWLFAPETSMLEGVGAAGMLRLAFAALYLLAAPSMAREAACMSGGELKAEEENNDAGNQTV